MTSIEDLPDSIICDILVCLPTKDVFRCRAVCKSWRRETSTRNFILTHHRRQPLLPLVKHFEKDVEQEYFKDPRIMVLRNQNLIPVVRLPTLALGHTWLYVYGSYDGLLVISRTIYEELGVTKCFYVCNPATRQLFGLTQIFGTERGAEPSINVVGFYGHSSGEYRGA